MSYYTEPAKRLQLDLSITDHHKLKQWCHARRQPMTSALREALHLWFDLQRSREAHDNNFVMTRAIKDAAE